MYIYIYIYNVFYVGNGEMMKVWEDSWVGKQLFPLIFLIYKSSQFLNLYKAR